MSIMCLVCQEKFSASFLGLKIVCPHCKTDLSARAGDPSLMANGLSALLIVVLITLYLTLVQGNSGLGQGAKIAIGAAMLAVLYFVSRYLTFWFTVRKINRMKDQTPD